MLQDLEPDGIGAKDLKECLKIQLIKRGILDENLEDIIDNYLDSIADNKYINISKALKITPKEAQELWRFNKNIRAKTFKGVLYR